MALSTSTAGLADFDPGARQRDDVERRRPIAEWLRALPESIDSDAAPTAPWPAAAPRQPIRRLVRSEPVVSEAPTPPSDLSDVCDLSDLPELSEFPAFSDLPELSDFIGASEPVGACETERTAAPAAPVRPPARPEPFNAGATSRRAVLRSVIAVVVVGATLILGQAATMGLSTGGATARAAELGEVVVSSHPSGAPVLLNGVEQGTTPLVLRLATGRHRLEIAGAGGSVQPLDTEVMAGRSVSHHVELVPPASTSGDGILIVDTGDPVAQLSIDGTPAGATPLASTRVTPGQHTVLVRYRGGAIVERQVIVPADETVSLVLDPPTTRPSPTAGPISGWVRISAPFPVHVFERGQLVGSSVAERILLEAGPHTLELVNAALGFRANTTTRVAAGKVADVVVETPRVPVAINAQPWAQVIVDGRAHGDTPIANLMLPIGDHRVVLRHPELGEHVQMVTVRAAGSNRVSADLRR